MNATYSVKQLAKLAGVSIRTLHLYDQLGLLKPKLRTLAGYRLYGVEELLRLQQILFYKELDFPLKSICQILDEPGFNLISALETHKKAIFLKKKRINLLLKTIDKTIHTLKNNTMLNLEELYDGLSPTEANAYRDEAMKSYGTEIVERAEHHLKNLNKEEIKVLILTQKELAKELTLLVNQDPTGANVQHLIDQHYRNTRKLWGTENASDPQAESYKGLGQLYLSDERFTMIEGSSNEEFRHFLSVAMAYYADKLGS